MSEKVLPRWEGHKIMKTTKRKDRAFRCLSTFSSEKRMMLKGEVYTAEPMVEDGWTLIFENGAMNFTDELFERVVKDWSEVIEEVEE